MDKQLLDQTSDRLSFGLLPWLREEAMAAAHGVWVQIPAQLSTSLHN